MKKPRSTKQDGRVMVNFTLAEKKLLKAEARRSRVPLAALVRSRALNNV